MNLPNELIVIIREKTLVNKYSNILLQDLPQNVFDICYRDKLYHLFELNQATLEWALESGLTPIFDYALERSRAVYLRK